jgi:hypothetical protein
MPGVLRELAEHRLEVNKTARPIKQKLRRFAKDRKQAIEVEVCKLLVAGFIRECQHPVWLANPVLVPKKIGGLRMCIVVWTSLGPLPWWVPGPTTRWALGLLDLCCTTPDGVKCKDYGGEVLG